MTYQNAIDNLSSLQAVLTAAQTTVTLVQPLVDTAQSVVPEFHKYIIDWTPSGDVTYSNLQFPPDATVNGDQAFVIRDSVPDPVPCQVAHYDSGSLMWGDAIDTTIGWSNAGVP